MIKWLIRFTLLIPVVGFLLFLWAIYDGEFEVIEKIFSLCHGIFIGTLGYYEYLL